MSAPAARFKAIALLAKRADIDRAAFVDYYENQHAPLILSLLPGILAYQRNYADFEGAFVSAGAAPFDFDAVTEMWFADRAAYDRMFEVAGEPEVAARIAADEENFLDRDRTRMFVVEERASVVAELNRAARTSGNRA